MDDEEWRYRWIANGILPFEQEIRRRLRRASYSLTPQDVDDLVQEGYARLWQSDFSEVENPKGFFYSIIRHVWLDQIRRARVVPIDRIEESASLYVDESPGPEQRASARQDFERFMRIVHSMPLRRRAVFEAKQFSGWSTEETAERLGISTKTVESHMRNAVAQLMGGMLGNEDSRIWSAERDGAKLNERSRKRD
jgi:RNA polymerase sigma factor (sigma-70 family)